MATPVRPANLTAAEALLLQQPQANQGRAALKLTLIELLARRRVVMRQKEQKGRFGRVQRVDSLHVVGAAAQSTPKVPHVEAVLAMVQAAGAADDGAPVAHVVQQAQKHFGADLRAFQMEHVLPALVDRGLVEPYEAKRLWLFPATRYRRTALGDAVHQELATHLEQAKKLPDVMERSPAETVALIATLGTSVLLVAELKPHYARLSQVLRRADADSGGGDDVDTIDGDDDRLDTTTDATFNVAAFNSADIDGLDVDFSAFDALDTSVEAFDSSFDASSDSGGSDGGDGGGND